jgi:transcriptional regulator with XRE-family HTH domain
MAAETRPTMARGPVGLFWRKAEGNYVRGLRLAAGLTQAELAERVGLANKQTISAVENGRIHVPVERCLSFGPALGVSTREFCTWCFRFQSPFLFAGVFGLDERLARELDEALARTNVRRGPRGEPSDT